MGSQDRPRAVELINALDGEIKAYLADEGNDVIATPSATTSSAWDLHLRLTSLSPLRWSAVVGDVLHNARSAVDAYAYAVITSHQPDLEDKHLRRLGFPITADKDEFNKHAWLAGQNPVPLIERAFSYARPWFRLEGLEGFDDPKGFVDSTSVRRLWRLNNEDKHKTIHLTICNPSMMWSGLPEDATVTEWRHIDAWPWEDGSHIATVIVDGLVGDASPSFGHDLDVALVEDSAPLRMHSLISMLTDCRGAAVEAIAQVQWVLDHQ